MDIPRMSRGRDYKRAVEWIAFNDEDAILDLEFISEMATVALVADLFYKSVDTVAVDVYNKRSENQ